MYSAQELRHNLQRVRDFCIQDNPTNSTIPSECLGSLGKVRHTDVALLKGSKRNISYETNNSD
jgi:hypothetical protein